ncbi:hypothetical protein RRG08_006988 [Elysia crispata]|uniref:Signal recognition particle receptor subunit beta n=1 Tax=Elysia crispata TaxID=231223 RepID=A0AAE1DT04_9GAST|nr:hypothetical protein RRG08_006988 [Elysia crispata]
MGNYFGRDPRNDILILGLDDAGKTALLSTLKLGKILTFSGTHYETIDVNGVSLTCLDLSGRNKERPMIHLSTGTARGFVHVIDSTDAARLDEALDELVKFVLLEKKTLGTVVMVLANKQDIPGALTALEVEDALKRKYKFSSTSPLAHTVFVRPCSVLAKEGIHEAFGEFVNLLDLKRCGKAKPGLLSLVTEDQNGGNFGRLGVEAQKESLALAKVKAVLKNPFCFRISKAC